MAQAANKTRRKDDEAHAGARYIKGSPRKLNLVAQLIRGKSAARALVDLEFSTRRMAREVKKVLEAAIANAENNHNLDVDRLVVKEATVGRALVMGRFHARGRGRSAAIEKPFSNILIVVAERAEKEKAKKDGKKDAPAKGKTRTTKKAAGDVSAAKAAE